MNYCIDASALLEGSSIRPYSMESFPGLWQRMAQLIADGRLFSPDEIRRELERKADQVFEWAKTQDGLFVPLDEEVQVEVADIMGRFRRLVENRGGGRQRSGGDPFVIALAKLKEAVVVTQEHATGNIEKPRIPDVCNALGVKWTNLLGLIQNEEWTFS